MKNIVLITGYSLLTAFFLCTPPLCAQEKVLDRMTRSEARQEILRHTEIKDHVTFIIVTIRISTLSMIWQAPAIRRKCFKAKPFY